MKHIDSMYWVIVFTDIKGFTLKTSLLTQKQIEDILNKQDEIVLPIIKKNGWKIIKTMWDSYMIIFEKPLNSINASIEIQRKLNIYNLSVKLNLYKIEIRITADYWLLNKKENLIWEDYFWTSVNIASRLQDKTPENKIFISWELQKEIKNIKKIKNIYLLNKNLI